MPRERRGKNVGFIGMSSMGADSIDDIGRTRERICGKAKRYKNVENLIIALRCDVSNNRLDQVLFGTQKWRLYIRNDSTDTTPLPARGRRSGLLWTSPSLSGKGGSSFLFESLLEQANAKMDQVSQTCAVH